MEKYIKDGHVISATDKAYSVVYSNIGYVPYVEEKPKSKKKNTKGED